MWITNRGNSSVSNEQFAGFGPADVVETSRTPRGRTESAPRQWSSLKSLKRCRNSERGRRQPIAYRLHLEQTGRSNVLLTCKPLSRHARRP